MILKLGWSPTGFSLAALALDQALVLTCYNLAFVLLFPRRVPHVLAETWFLAVAPFFYEPAYVRFFGLSWLALTLLLVTFGTYRNAFLTTYNYQARQTMKAIVGAAALLLGWWLAFGGVSGDFLMMLTGFWLLLLPLFKLLVGDLRLLLKRLGVGRVRTVLAGQPGEVAALARRIQTGLKENYAIVAYLPDREDDSLADLGDAPVLPAQGFQEALLASQPHQVLFPEPITDEAQLAQVRAICAKHGIAVRSIPCAQTVEVGETRVHDLLGVPLEMPRSLYRGRPGYAVKRLIDLVGAAALLLVLSPLLVVVAILVRLDSPGPIFYAQTRLTRGRRPFKILKFRSMYVDADRRLEELRAKSEVGGPIFKMKDDPRITRTGKWLRKLSIDEVPQFINVLQGHLSLVGPRPPIPAEVEKYTEWQLRRLEVLGGITGLWQVSGRSSIDFEEMVLLDLYYIENWSLLLDLEILLDTPSAVLVGRGAF